ncbi:hypothetical protein HPP92_018965 [Vanilla planifolia]|uniref:hydroxymethylglutaryl-CoA reductase (NADPH) n=1 Tax=Vanilla planifolia TaxID=51239 RepID=A0A835QAW8_VANPL|nr:hypothetical protein HPP92_018965 [Vanilla planifolia]
MELRRRLPHFPSSSPSDISGSSLAPRCPSPDAASDSPASLIYLLSFFGIAFVQSVVSSNDDEVEEFFSVSSPPPVSDNKVIASPAPVAEPASLVLPECNDEEIIASVVCGKTPSYSLESVLGDCHRATAIRREALSRISGRELEGLPLDGFDYGSILGQCCELPVGYVQLPVGIAGPLMLDGREFYVPMATTEGDGMTRAPVVRFPTAARAAELKFFLEESDNYDTLSVVFNRSSRFARLQGIKCSLAGRNLYVRFSCSTGDAMGMNMVSKGVQNVLDYLQNGFPDMDVISISSNFCSDKKPAAVNWIEGRGKSVVSVAGALGGYNAHASNIVTAIFIATGQDPAQNVESSHCITMMEAVNKGKDLHISVTMPSIEVGTVGGGTQLASQSACLDLLGVKGSCFESPGSNARLLATIVASSARRELSLMSALAAGHLVRSHMKYNRSVKDVSKVAS